MSFRTLDDLGDVRAKRVLVRVDLNVPMDHGKVTDATRIERVAPTVRELAEHGAVVVLLSHFGRPKGKRDPDMSLEPVVVALAEHLARPVAFADDCVGEVAEQAIAVLVPGEVILLENTRFHPGDEANDPDFARQLAALGEIYVNDAFSAAHRAHASTEGVARLLPAFAGRAMQQELEALEAALGSPERPVAAVVGGAKVSTKIDLLENLVGRVDTLVIGGGMANTFLAARGVDVGKSLCERELADTAGRIEQAAADAGCRIVLPVDVVLAREFAEGAANRTAALDDIGADEMILDLGEKSIEAVNAVFNGARTLVWNGPLGAFEVRPFDRATVAAARHAAELTRAGRLNSIAGGGDTVSALNHAGAADGFSYISTAGGAFLEWLEGKTLPGVAALAKVK